MAGDKERIETRSLNSKE